MSSMYKPLSALYHLMRSDFLERLRSYQFLGMLLFTIFLTYLFIPSLETIQPAGLQLGEGDARYRAVYNSAWIGSMTTLLMGEFFLLFSFYLLKGAIERDRLSGVGQIIAATPISKYLYAIGKWLSHVAVVTAMLIAILFAAILLQIIHNEDISIDLWAIANPFLWILFPALCVVSALAVLFECIKPLRGAIGNVIFFFAFLFISAGLDLAGIRIIYPSIYAACSAQFPACNPHRQIDIGMPPLMGLPTFEYQGVEWTLQMVLGRLLLILLSIGIIWLSAQFFHRFDPSSADGAAVRSQFTKKKKLNPASRVKSRGHTQTLGHLLEPDDPASYVSGLSSQPSLSRPIQWIHNPILSSWQWLAAELRLGFKSADWMWHIIALVLWIACWIIPLDIAHLVILPLAWIWPLRVWSQLGARESQNNTQALVFSAPHALIRGSLAVWLAGVLVALWISSGVWMRLAWVGQASAAFCILAGSTFIASLALAFGTWSGSSKLFEGFYLFIWYISTLYTLPYLDFMGRSNQSQSWETTWFFLSLSAGLFALAVLGRKRLMSR